MTKDSSNIWFEASSQQKLIDPQVILNSLKKFGADVEQKNCNFKYYYFTWGETHQQHRHHWGTFKKYFGGFKQAMELAGVHYDPQYRNKLQSETVEKELRKFCSAHVTSKRTARNYYLWPQRRLGYASYKAIDRSWYKALEQLGFSAPQSSKSAKLTDDDVLIAIERISIWTFEKKRTIPQAKDFREYNMQYSDGVSWATLSSRYYKASEFISNFFAWKRGELTKNQLLLKAKRPSRQPLPAKLRYDVMKRDNFKCQLCGVSSDSATLHVDHIIAVTNGGENTPSNLQTLCEPCNIGKGTN